MYGASVKYGTECTLNVHTECMAPLTVADFFLVSKSFFIYISSTHVILKFILTGLFFYPDRKYISEEFYKYFSVFITSTNLILLSSMLLSVMSAGVALLFCLLSTFSV